MLTFRSVSTVAVRSSFRSKFIKPNCNLTHCKKYTDLTISAPNVKRVVTANSFHTSPCSWQGRQQGKKIKRAVYSDVLKLVEDCHMSGYIIDVREPKTIEQVGAIPTSINIPLAEVQKAFQCMNEEEFLKRYKRAKPLYRSDIIFYCMSGEKSGNAQAIAIALGYAYAANYAGGWTEWEKLQKIHHK